MKAVYFLIGFVLPVFIATAQHEVNFRSSDKKLENAFSWAKETALSYKGRPGDPVGPWYESALPPRSAFCMRDVSHQSIGGEILGLYAENKNMLSLFARNISESKDWCSYWEMNRYGVPAPEDYRNDKEFWYNLNANFDILHACWRMYLWTGDRTYIDSTIFKNFHELTMNNYIARWILQTDSLLLRPAYPNAPVPFNEDDAFHRCRGLPSYSEGVPHLKMGIDLIASIFRAHESFASMLELQGNKSKAEQHRAIAKQYRQHIAQHWWDDQASLYNTHITSDGKFGKGEGETFLLWFEALEDSTKINPTVRHLTSQEWNVENLSYFPYVMSRYGFHSHAYKYIVHLADSNTERREYPEVSFGVLEGIVQGLMGIDADARANRVSTLFSGNETDSFIIEKLPVLQGTISVGETQGSAWLLNSGKKEITWRVMFRGHQDFILAKGRKIKTLHSFDRRNRPLSYADIIVKPGGKLNVRIN